MCKLKWVDFVHFESKLLVFFGPLYKTTFKQMLLNMTRAPIGLFIFSKKPIPLKTFTIFNETIQFFFFCHINVNLQSIQEPKHRDD